MTFEEKSTLTMTALLVVVSAAYFAAVLGPATSRPDHPATFTSAAVAATVVLTILTVVSHVVLALVFRSRAGAGHDERDRIIALRTERLSAATLAVGMFVGIVLAMLQVPVFWIAQSLILACVAAEISKGAVKLVLLAGRLEMGKPTRVSNRALRSQAW